MNNLPQPTSEEKIHSEKLQTIIATEIKRKGPISFHDFMQKALYQPQLGYYRAGTHKFGSQGDFVTAPEISSLFSWCIARQCAEILSKINHPSILELGAGSGRMALEILRELERLNCLPEYYYILEPSADLKQRQLELFAEQGSQFLNKIKWLSELPPQLFSGVMLANEVIDAIPIHKFKIENNVFYEFYVDVHNGEFQWQSLPAKSPRLITEIENLNISSPEYASEINLMLKPWIKTLADSLQEGVVILIDYGFVRREYYHPERAMGTLMCHYRHRAHDNPLILVGIQDITAFVDFTRVAEAALDAHLEISGFTHQAGFLLNCGIMDFSQMSSIPEQYAIAQQIKRLILPSEMGEKFKVIALSKDYSEPLSGFREFDQLDKL